MLAGKGESQRTLQIGLSEASVLMQKIGSFGDPRLYALSLVAEHLSKSQQPLVPQHMFVSGGGGTSSDGQSLSGGQGLLGTLISLLVAEKSGFKFDGNGTQAQALDDLKQLTDDMSRQAMSNLKDAATVAVKPGTVTAGLGKEGDRKLS